MIGAAIAADPRTPVDKTNGGHPMPSIDITPAQARALADLSMQVGSLALHQLTSGENAARAGDVYVTPHGRDTGYRVDMEGRVSPMGETLPAAD